MEYQMDHVLAAMDTHSYNDLHIGHTQRALNLIAWIEIKDEQ
jgi:hypothetical protein